MAQSVKHFLHKYKYQSSIPEPTSKAGHHAHTCKHGESGSEEGTRWSAVLTYLVPGLSERPCLKKYGRGLLRNDTQG